MHQYVKNIIYTKNYEMHQKKMNQVITLIKKNQFILTKNIYLQKTYTCATTRKKKNIIYIYIKKL